MNVIRFGTFEVHLATSELYKQGRLVRLQAQPFEVLCALLEQPGRLVTRQELRERLWADGTTVEFDQSLNKSVTKLRTALGDLAGSPRFVETLPKRGYRFIADVHLGSSADVADTHPLPIGSAVVHPPTDLAPSPPISPPHAPTWAATGREALRPWDWPRRLVRHSRHPAVLATSGGIGALLLVIGLTARGDEGGVPEPPGPPTPATSPIHAARDAFERGHVALSRRSSESLRRSVEHFDRAVSLSPRFAPAHVGVADSWHLLASDGAVDPREAMPRARNAATRALTIDPSSAAAHAALGRTAWLFDWDHMTAGWHFARALALQSGHTAAHQWRAAYFSTRGEHEQAINDARRAVASAPLSLSAHSDLGQALYLARRFDQAAAHLEDTLAIDPDFVPARRLLALVQVQQGQLAAATFGFDRVVAMSNGAPWARAERAWLSALRGDAATARAALADLDRLRETTFVSPDAVALVYTALGARDEALAWLERALTLRVPRLAFLAVDPVWDAIRDDQRTREIMREIARE